MKKCKVQNFAICIECVYILNLTKTYLYLNKTNYTNNLILLC